MIELWYYWILAALSIAVFWMLPARWRFAFLGAVSIGFIASVEPATVAMMAVICVLVYLPTKHTKGRPLLSALNLALIVFVAGFLFYFKYLPSISTAFGESYSFANLLLPLGISYFAFKLIHFVIERARGHLPDHDFWDYLAWVFLVPIFTAGPIQRFDLFMTQRSQSWSNEFAWDGLTRIAMGLIKKFIVGAFFASAMLWLSKGGLGNMLANLEDFPSWRIIGLLIAAYLFIYMDFSGYSDVAIGTSRLFGLKIMENFNFPIFAPNIGNLWKRWHMSLANWCQSYIYMPTLGATRNPYAAVVCSFLVMGLWHAASWNWVFWGLYNAAGVAVYQWWSLTARKRKWAIIKTRLYQWAAYPLTFLFFAGSFAFTMTAGEHGLYAAFRLLAKCLTINI